MGMATDLANQPSDLTGDPDLDQWAGYRTSPYLNQLLQNGIPRNVAEYILSQPSYAEGERPHSTRPYEPTTPYRGWDDYETPQPNEVGSEYERWLMQHLRQPPRAGQNISYQPGAGGMPGMPHDMARLRLMMQIMSARGMGGMQRLPFQLAGDVVGLGTGSRPLIPANEDPYADILRSVLGPKRMVPATPGSVQSPGLLDNDLSPANSNRLGPLAGIDPQIMQLLQYYMAQQQNGGLGNYPQGGGGVTLADLLTGRGTQMAGDVFGFGLPSDQMNIQRSTPTPPWPQNNPFPFDLYHGPSGGPPVDFSYPPARRMVPANEANVYRPSYG